MPCILLIPIYNYKVFKKEFLLFKRLIIFKAFYSKETLIIQWLQKRKKFSVAKIKWNCLKRAV